MDSIAPSVFKIEAAGISEAMIFRTCDLSLSHPDPFDRLLAAQAIENGYTIYRPTGNWICWVPSASGNYE